MCSPRGSVSRSECGEKSTAGVRTTRMPSCSARDEISPRSTFQYARSLSCRGGNECGRAFAVGCVATPECACHVSEPRRRFASSKAGQHLHTQMHVQRLSAHSAQHTAPHLLQREDDVDALGGQLVDVQRVPRLAAHNHVWRDVVVAAARANWRGDGLDEE